MAHWYVLRMEDGRVFETPWHIGMCWEGWMVVSLGHHGTLRYRRNELECLERLVICQWGGIFRVGLTGRMCFVIQRLSLSIGYQLT